MVGFLLSMGDEVERRELIGLWASVGCGYGGTLLYVVLEGMQKCSKVD